MSTQTHHRCSAANEDEAVLAWTVHLARQFPRKIAVLAGAIFVACVAGYSLMGLLGAIAVTFVLVASWADYLFPIRFEITPTHITCKRLLGITQIKWVDVKRCYIDDLGIKLSPLDRISRLEAFRGVYLRFDGNREQVLDTVRSLRAR